MTYQGTVKHGVIILDPSAKLPEGARVRVETMDNQSASHPHFRPVGTWDGPPGELDQLLTQVQQLRDSDLTNSNDDSLSP
ncbi:MAG: hypothetical protein NTU53_13815 [Planctomycetota bacterium]|nr:hypothetical protein [Planctomycetota bacterium]